MYLFSFCPALMAGQNREKELMKKITLKVRLGWVDTGLDVSFGDHFHFRASGEISLQQGNPAAVCGPEGLEIVTTQQPIPDKNTGGLIGKVVQLISIRKDEKTGEEVREEIIQYFWLGRENQVYLPLKGRLFLGINESVYQDNDGEFTIEIFRLKD